MVFFYADQSKVIMVLGVIHFGNQSGQSVEFPRSLLIRDFGSVPCLVFPSLEVAGGKLAGIAQDSFRAVRHDSPCLFLVVFFYSYRCGCKGVELPIGIILIIIPVDDFGSRSWSFLLIKSIICCMNISPPLGVLTNESIENVDCG